MKILHTFNQISSELERIILISNTQNAAYYQKGQNFFNNPCPLLQWLHGKQKHQHDVTFYFVDGLLSEVGERHADLGPVISHVHGHLNRGIYCELRSFSLTFIQNASLYGAIILLLLFLLVHFSQHFRFLYIIYTYAFRLKHIV